MAHGDKLAEVALKLADQANTMGISGNQFDGAVEMLVHCWAYGEELRQWDNARVQLRREGTAANASGALLRTSSLLQD